ncbi:MAG: DUF2652 domain-containing protein [Planctomycetia bacterium]|nr:DUF2652 domain-containing protein [Planctomycetia bacterium]
MDTPLESEVLLLIADISGYTRFMLTNHTARVHAHGIVADLLGVVAREARPPLAVNKFEGDAIFMVAPRPASGWHDAGRTLGARLTGFIDVFNRRLTELASSNICDCIACQQMVSLRLKVIAHYGVAVRSRIAGFDEVSGVDVILIHRLLKNEIQAAEYVLLTEPAYAFLEPPGDYVARRESYDDVGQVPVRLRAIAAAVPAAAPRRFSLVDAWRKIGYDVRYLLARRRHPAA